MQPDYNDGVISADLERTCAYEPIHLLGTVQAYGFVIVADAASGRVVQVSSGITVHWPGLADASALLGTALADWITCADAAAALHDRCPVLLPCQPRFAATGHAATVGMTISVLDSPVTIITFICHNQILSQNI